MRLYLGGQMRGLPDFGHSLFDHADMTLREMGHEVFNPAAYDREHDTISADVRICLAADMAWILAHSEGMVVLSNWPSSLGAKAEILIHHAINLPVWQFEEFVLSGPGGHQIKPRVSTMVVMA